MRGEKRTDNKSLIKSSTSVALCMSWHANEENKRSMKCISKQRGLYGKWKMAKKPIKLLLHTYIIGHYNPSVRITA